MKKTKEQLYDYLNPSLDPPGAIGYTVISAVAAVLFILLDLAEKQASFRAVFALAALLAAVPLGIWYSKVRRGKARRIYYSYLFSGFQYLVVYGEFFLGLQMLHPIKRWSPLDWGYFTVGLLFCGAATVLFRINFRRWEQEKPPLPSVWLISSMFVPLTPMIYVFFRYGVRGAWRRGLSDDPMAQSFVFGGGHFLLLALVLTGAVIGFVRFAAARKYEKGM
ncbi:MAG: hypothetical protein IJP27_09595 [Clostridia bacterium]|nr:hypothetical protein [Clostridia bacterium]